MIIYQVTILVLIFSLIAASEAALKPSAVSLKTINTQNRTIIQLKDKAELIKPTIRRLLADKQTLKDDLAIVRMDRDGWILFEYVIPERHFNAISDDTYDEKISFRSTESWFDLEMQITNYLVDHGQEIYGVNIIINEPE